MLLFLFFSFELPVTCHPIIVEGRGFSIALLLSLIASIFLPRSLFWVAFLFIVVTIPFHGEIFDLSYTLFQLLCWHHSIHSHHFHSD
ncbi:hypothetical protein DITRI_Ditri13aG0131100 [Diplodiscus trichospermus]